MENVSCAVNPLLIHGVAHVLLRKSFVEERSSGLEHLILKLRRCALQEGGLNQAMNVDFAFGNANKTR